MYGNLFCLYGDDSVSDIISTIPCLVFGYVYFINITNNYDTSFYTAFSPMPYRIFFVKLKFILIVLSRVILPLNVGLCIPSTPSSEIPFRLFRFVPGPYKFLFLLQSHDRHTIPSSLHFLWHQILQSLLKYPGKSDHFLLKKRNKETKT